MGGVTGSRSAYKLVLDNNGGVYVSIRYGASEIAGNNNNPPACFGENNCLPYLSGDLQQEEEGRKNMFLLKYDTDNGDLIWRKDYQGNVSYYNASGFIANSSDIDHPIPI